MIERVLVVGASGALGRVIAGKLIDRGGPVRGMSRDPARLDDLTARGAEAVRGDLRMPETLVNACAGMTQIVSTANSFAGADATSPTRVDVPGYRALLEAARASGVRRIVHISAHGVTRESPVDYFRVKAEVDDLIRRSGIPCVLVRPSAFLDAWAGMGLTEASAGRPARVFGDGCRVANYIAIADVAEFAVRILAARDLVNDEIDVGGPSTLSQNELIDLVEKGRGQPVRRQRLPRPVLQVGAVLLRPFNERLARLMALGAWSAGCDRRLDHWPRAADRFGLQPMTAEAFLASP